MKKAVVKLECDSLADQINALHAEILGAARTTLDRAIEIGRLLTERKAQLKHGEWLPWVKQKLEFSRQTVDNYVRCYQRRDELKLLTIGNLTDAYKMLGGPSKQQANGRRDCVRHDLKLGGFVTDLAELSGRQFGCIYADPPWDYDNQATRAATSNHYDTLSVEKICAMPIGTLVAEKSHLHLWTTNAFLFSVPQIFDAWGFEYKSTFVWVKTQMGIGNYWRNAHEILVLGIRGGQRAIARDQMSWLQSDRTKHSAKPDEVRARIEKLSPGPYLELFGRAPKPGWTVFGNEVTS